MKKRTNNLKKKGRALRFKIVISRFTVLFTIILVFCAFLRLCNLELRTVHHDEAVYASFVQGILRNGNYQYDAEYHGPVLFFLDALAFKIFGERVLSLRIFPAIFGIIILFLLIPIRKYIGDKSVLALAFFIAVSPMYEYFARFGFHETLYMFFMLLLIIFLFKYTETQRKIFFYLCAFCSAMLFSIKEVSYFIVPAIFSFFPLKALFSHMRSEFSLGKNLFKAVAVGVKNFISESILWVKKHAREIIISIAIFLFIFIMLYSCFFRYPENLRKAFTQPIIHSLTKAVERSGHNKPFTYYLSLAAKLDIFVVFFAIIGLFINRKNTFSRFLIYISFMIILVMSITPYKTPWNGMFVLFPLMLISALPIEKIFELFNGRRAAAIALISIIALSAFSTMIRINFVDHSIDARNPLAYAHAGKGMEEAMEGIIQKYPVNTSMIISATEVSYWPIPWYLRDYTNAGYYGELPENVDYEVAIVSISQNETFLSRAKYNYSETEFETHPGTRFVIFSRKE